MFLKITTLTSFSLRKTITLVKITAAEQQQKQKQEIQKADQKIACWYRGVHYVESPASPPRAPGACNLHEVKEFIHLLIAVQSHDKIICRIVSWENRLIIITKYPICKLQGLCHLFKNGQLWI